MPCAYPHPFSYFIPIHILHYNRKEIPELATSIYTFPSTTLLSSSEVREVLSHVDILLTTRLYMAIAAISVKTPALVLGNGYSVCCRVYGVYNDVWSLV